MSRPAAAADSSAASSSGSKRSFTGATTGSERRVLPRHFHAGANPVAAAASGSGDAAAAESVGPPPAAMLYRHALESIFAFCNRSEVVAALQVSKNWLAAVKSMASLRLKVAKPSASLRVMAQSAMGHHVAVLGADEDYISITSDLLSVVARLMPQLRVLKCDLKWTPTETLAFPVGLLELHLLIIGSPAAEDINAALRVISCLPLLEVFILHLDDFNEQLSFAPLASMPLLLRQLSIIQMEPDDDDTAVAELSDVHVAELRALPLLRWLDVQPMSTLLLRRLLAQPHELQWQWISLPDELSDAVADLMPQLPTLTVFDNVLSNINSLVTCSNFDFLRRLPQLITVRIMLKYPSAAGRIDSLMAALPCCSQLENLGLASTEISAAHLSELLPRLPRLHSLTLENAVVTTLAFLAQPPMTGQLKQLRLICCNQLPLADLRRVHALRVLKELYLNESFDEPMDTLCQSLHTPPSPLLPRLEHFEYTPPQPNTVQNDGDDDEAAEVEDDADDDEGEADE